MRIVALDLLLVILLFTNSLQGQIVTTCERVLHIHCDSYRIVIVKVNTTSSIVSNLLEQCNTHQKCGVLNTNQECLQVTYWCRIDQDNVMIKPESTTKVSTRKSLINLVSKDYKKGFYQEAENIQCNLRTDTKDKEDGPRQLIINVYELAPFVKSSKFCLYVEGSDIPYICSGSKDFYTSHGPFNGTGNWQFGLRLSNDESYVPMVRFWIEVKVSPEEADFYILQCDSKPAPVASPTLHMTGDFSTDSSTGSTTQPMKQSRQAMNVFIPVIGGLCGLSAICGVACLWATLKWRRERVSPTNEILQPIPASESPRVPRNDDQPIYWEVTDHIRPPPLPPFRSSSMNQMPIFKEIPQYHQVLPSLPLQMSAPNLLDNFGQQMAPPEQACLEPSGVNGQPLYLDMTGSTKVRKEVGTLEKVIGDANRFDPTEVEDYMQFDGITEQVHVMRKGYYRSWPKKGQTYKGKLAIKMTTRRHTQ